MASVSEFKRVEILRQWLNTYDIEGTIAKYIDDPEIAPHSNPRKLVDNIIRMRGGELEAQNNRQAFRRAFEEYCLAEQRAENSSRDSRIAALDGDLKAVRAHNQEVQQQAGRDRTAASQEIAQVRAELNQEREKREAAEAKVVTYDKAEAVARAVELTAPQ